jgi:hypothetical protein
LMLRFANRAFRRPVELVEIDAYIREVHDDIDEQKPLGDALIAGYRSLLCSPRFMFFQESPGALDGYAIAARLSYLLWQSMPDEALLSLASQGKLHEPAVLIQQTRRMLDDARGKDFTDRLGDQWLDLRDIDFTQPDPKLYRQFDLVVQQSMLEETQSFLRNLLAENRSVTELIDSDHTFLNSRLARYYDIEGVRGDAIRKVKLRPEHHRGGVLTQGAILKVTANGTTTSPVIRGVWIAERLLGEHIPPPPQNVPAIEPDIRGATSIRDMLEKHRSDDACAACHVKMDPPGFALENFDPAGRWRERYGTSKDKKKSLPVDPSYQLADGRAFEDLDEFKELVLEEPEKVAQCVAEKLLTYGTGAPPRYVDRAALDRIVKESATEQYGFRTLLERVICSEPFLIK